MTDNREISYEIRPVRKEDTAQIAEAEQIVFSAEAWTKNTIELTTTYDDVIFLGAFDGDRLLGYIVLTTCDSVGYIDNVCVMSDARRRHIAERMLREAMEEAARVHGAASYTLEVRVTNQGARALYEKLGFAFEGVRPGYYTQPREDAAIYWKR